MRNYSVVVAAAALSLAPQAVAAQPKIAVNFATAEMSAHELAAVRTTYAEAMNAGDVERIIALYAADALVLPADRERHYGNVAIADYVRRVCQTPGEGTQVTLTPNRFSVGATLASETGTFTESREGHPPTTGAYIVIYTKAGDAWRIAMEVRTRGRDTQIAWW